jgi:hypothetical protein
MFDKPTVCLMQERVWLPSLPLCVERYADMADTPVAIPRRCIGVGTPPPPPASVPVTT